MLSALGQEGDKVTGLNMGADDYIAKPFGVMELVARVHAALRRQAGSNVIKIGDLELNSDTMSVTLEGRPLELNKKEFELLKYCMRNADIVLSRDALLTEIWGYVDTETRTLDNHIARLRKMGIDNFETVFGVGYDLKSDKSSERVGQVCVYPFFIGKIPSRNTGGQEKMRKKILWISQLIIAVVLLIYAVLSTQVFYNNLIAGTEKNLKVYMNLFDIKEYTLDEEGADRFSAELSGLRITFLNVGGDVLADSEKEELGNHADREEVRLALSQGEGYSVRRSSSLGENMIYYCRKISAADGTDYLVRISVLTSSEWRVFKENLPTLVWFLLLDFLICLLFTYIETEYIISPVRKLAKDASLNLKISTKYSELQPIADILNRRNREVTEQFAELSEEKALVERAQRSKNDFIANITHEMNTPLTSIRGYSELLAGGALNEEQTKTAAATLVKQSDRLSKLIACIINYNEIDNDELPAYEVNVSRLAAETLDVLAPEISQRGIVLSEKIEPDIVVMSRHRAARRGAGESHPQRGALQ